MTQQVLLQLRTGLAMGNDVRSARRSETSQPEDWRVLNEKIKLILTDINFTYGPAAYYRNMLILKPWFLLFITVFECSESSRFSFFLVAASVIGLGWRRPTGKTGAALATAGPDLDER